MKSGMALICLMLLIMSGTSEANDNAKDQSISIINSVVGVCQTRGMLACEPHIRGADFLFKYIRLFDQLAELDDQFKLFLLTNYPSDGGVDFDIIQASLNLSMEITITPEQFASRIRDAHRVENGYDVTMDNGQILKLRKENNDWVAIFPPDMGGQFKTMQPFYTAGLLKRSILIYRMIEADMADLSKDQLEENVSTDIAPILVAMFGKEK